MMKTKLCIIIFVASAFCAPPDLVTEASVETKIDLTSTESISPAFVITKHEINNILPVYETKLVHTSHTLKSCSPNCHLDIFKKPLYLVIKSEASPEPEIIFLSDGLKSFQPNEKIKLPNTLNDIVIVFTKNDFPSKLIPQIIISKSAESTDTDVPYVVITDEKNLLEIIRDEKYEKVAEMEVTSDGLIKDVKAIKPDVKINDKVKDIAEGRTILTSNLKKILPLVENYPAINYYDSLKMVTDDIDLIRVEDKAANPLQDVIRDDKPRIPIQEVIRILQKYPSQTAFPKPVDTENMMIDENLRNYDWQLINSKIYPTNIDELNFKSLDYPDQVPSKYWSSPSTNRIPGQFLKDWNYVPDREAYILNPYNIPNRGLYKMDYLEQDMPKYHNLGYSSNYKPVENVEYLKDWENKYDPYYAKPFPGYYNKLPNYNSQMEMPYNYNMNPVEMNSQSIMKPQYNVIRPMHPPAMYSHHYPMPTYQTHPMPPKFSNSHRKPGITYILNICQDPRPVQLPEPPVKPLPEPLKPVSVVVHPVEEHKKPQPTMIKPTESPMHRKPISNPDSPANVIYKDYEPEFSFRSITNLPDLSDSDNIRKIFTLFKRPLHEVSHPSTKPPNFSPPELPHPEVSHPVGPPSAVSHPVAPPPAAVHPTAPQPAVPPPVVPPPAVPPPAVPPPAIPPPGGPPPVVKPPHTP